MQQQTSQNQQSQSNKKRWKAAEQHIASNNVINGGILAIFLIIFQAFIQVGLNNLCSYIIVISLAISMPCLVGTILINTHEKYYPYMQSAKIFNTIYGIGILSGFIGVVITFWYISWIVGIIFLSISLIVFILSIIHVHQLSKDENGKYMWK